MAYLCNRCRLASERRYANCPGCGGDLTQDTRSCTDLAGMGYRIVGKKAAQPSPTRVEVPDDGIHIRDDDTLACLRREYRESFLQNETRDDVFSVSSQWEARSEGQQNRSEGGSDFFSRYERVTAPAREERENRMEEPIVYIPPEPLPSRSRRSLPALSDFGDFLMALIRVIPWRLVFIVLILGGVAGVVMTIWNMRYIIINSILGFFVELIPLFLIIGGIVYMIRSLFR